MQTSNFIKIHPVETELFHADRWRGRQTDMMELIIVAFHNFANVPQTNCDQRKINPQVMQAFKSTEPLVYTMKKNTKWVDHDHLLSNIKDAFVQTLNFMSSVVMSIHICQYCHYRLHNSFTAPPPSPPKNYVIYNQPPSLKC